MLVLTRQFSRYIIALLLMTVLYGKSLVCVKSFAWKSTFSSTEDYGDSGSQDTENETESSPKPCKKPFAEMETGQFLSLSVPLLLSPDNLRTCHRSSSPSRLYQKVPIQPPLLSV
ncbi:MAG: hypothetical protein EOO09_14540 [Chitinophagaceae bacterium]|nr:MAG: hypothetical protein EOO09_14540 [Chitinophagaceae bacterium]